MTGSPEELARRNGHERASHDPADPDADLDTAQRIGPYGVDVMAEGLRTLGHDRSLTAVSRLTTTSALTSVPGATDASLTVWANDRFTTFAPTSELPAMVDALQSEHGGPCVDATTATPHSTELTEDGYVHAQDLRTDSRWPAFARAVLEQTPVLGVLAFQLRVGRRDEPIGSLNLYACKPHTFDTDSVLAGQRLAAYAAVVLAYTAECDRSRNLEQALHSSRDIGAAVGILMSRHLLTREQAFDLLVTTSQQSNRKLRELAGDVVHTGDLPPAHHRPDPTRSETVPTRPPLRIARALIGTSYPGSREDLIHHVLRHGGQPQVLEQLKQLPEQTFVDESDLADALRSER